jgi:hypothetical protein
LSCFRSSDCPSGEILAESENGISKLGSRICRFVGPAAYFDVFNRGTAWVNVRSGVFGRCAGCCQARRDLGEIGIGRAIEFRQCRRVVKPHVGDHHLERCGAGSDHPLLSIIASDSDTSNNRLVRPVSFARRAVIDAGIEWRRANSEERQVAPAILRWR